jgi:glutathione S-transferase
MMSTSVDTDATYTLINATPSPYGRKNAIAMLEKGIKFNVKWEKPWEKDAAVGNYSPLIQLPILLKAEPDRKPDAWPDPKNVVAYESAFINDYLEIMHPEPALMPKDAEGMIYSKKLQMLSERLMEATQIIFFEVLRRYVALIATPTCVPKPSILDPKP